MKNLERMIHLKTNTKSLSNLPTRFFLSLWRSYKLLLLAILGLITIPALTILKLSKYISLGLSLIAIIIALVILYKIWQNVRAGIYCAELPAITAIFLSILLHQYTLAFIVSIILVSQKPLEDLLTLGIRRSQAKLSKKLPSKTHVLRKHSLIEISTKDLIINDKVSLQAGDRVPTDGVILEGQAEINEFSLGHQTSLKTISVGDQILSGSILKEGKLIIRVTKIEVDSQQKQIIQISRSANASIAPIIKRFDRYSLLFILVVYIIAGLAWWLTKQPLRFLEVLVVATPSVFIFGPKIAILKGMNRALRDDIIFRTNKILELIADTKTIVFHKNHLTINGSTKINRIVAFRPFKQAELLIYASSISQRSRQSFFDVIRLELQAKKLRLLKVKHVTTFSNNGHEGRIGNKNILIGNIELMTDKNIKIPKNFKLNGIDRTTLLISVNEQLAGYITFSYDFRSDIKPTLKKLALLGVLHAFLITPDHQAAGISDANILGTTDIKASAKPGDELHIIEKIKDHPVLFIGQDDADSPALTAADIGVILSTNGQLVATQAADVIILKDDFNYIARAVNLGKWSIHISRQSTAIGVGVSLALMLIFATGKFAPIDGAIISGIVELLVMANALRSRLSIHST